MKCQFESLKFGDEVRLSGGTSCCGTCGADTQEQTEEILWKYVGHSDNLDVFEAITTRYCRSCGDRIDGYGQVCGEFGGLEVSGLFVKRPEPVKLGE